MSSHVIGLKPPDEDWKKMKAVYDACVVANIDVPDEVWSFFDGQQPDPNGSDVQIDVAVSSYRAEMREGFDVDVTRLPKGVKIVRFYNSY